MRSLLFLPVPVRVLTLTASVSFLCSTAWADEQVTAVQQALKEQQFFFGEVNGKRDEETRAAVRRFQIHGGLPVTGEIDAATIAAVENRNPDDAAVLEVEPQAERSVRGQMRNVVRSDEEFLQDVESTEPLEEPLTDIPPAPPGPPRPPGVTFQSSSTPQVAVSPVPQVAPQPAATQRSQAPRPDPIAEDNQPPESPARSVSPAPPAPPAPRREAAEVAPPTSRGMTEAEAERFVKGYLNAAERETPDGEVAHYADRVDYFTSGRVSRSFIEKDQRNYYRRWTQREFDLLGTELIKNGERSATVRFRTQYALRGNKDRASGKIENVVRLTRDEDGDWKIASIRERKLSR